MGGDIVILIAFISTMLLATNVGTLVALVHARRRVRQLERGAPGVSTVGSERLEQAIEAIAFEVERISEGQRFTTKLLAERQGLAPDSQARLAPGQSITPH